MRFKPRTCLLLIIVTSIISCRHRETVQEKRLRDTIEKIRMKADFKLLPADEAYAFLNKYYLPHLDTFPIGRKIFVHPYTATNFKEIFKKDSIRLSTKPAGDSTKKKDFTVVLTLNNPFYNQVENWQATKFDHVTLISDSVEKAIKRNRGSVLDRYQAFKKAYGKGYAMISHPQYNSHTSILLVKEFIEDGGTCGNGKERRLIYKKVGSAWKFESYTVY